MASFDDNGRGYLQMQNYVVDTNTRNVVLKTIFVGNIRWTGSTKNITIFVPVENSATSEVAFATGSLSRDAKYINMHLLNKSFAYRLQRH